MKPLLVVIILALSGGFAAGERRSEKPSAPVTLRLDAVPEPGGYRVRLIAVATRAVPALELAVAGERIVFGATAADQARELVTHVASKPGDASDVIGSATAGGRNRAASIHLGVIQRKAARRVVTRTLPDGREVAEAR